MPAGPIKRERIHPRGTMITSWRRRETIREGRPCPRASKTQAAMKATEEIKTGADHAQGFCPILHQLRICIKNTQNRAGKENRCNCSGECNNGYQAKAAANGTANPVMAFGSIVIPDNGTHSLEKAVAGKVYKGLELKIQSKGCYIDASKGSQDSI